MQLKARLYDLDETHLATLHQHEGIEVTWPLNDSRLASVTVSIYNDALRFVRPLDRILTIEYGPYLLFKGYVVKPVWNAAGRTVQINAHDATLKLKHHHHRYGDVVVNHGGYTLDGAGFRLLLESTHPSAGLLASGVIDNGIINGTNTVPGSSLQTNAARGSNVWDTLVALTQSAVGFDFDFEPVDQAHPPLSGTHTPGILAQVHTRPKVGTDRTGTVVFHYGFGADTAEDFVYEPDGDVVRNYWVEVNPGGEKHPADDQNKALVHDQGSWEQYGIYQGWESAGQHWPKSVLVERAKYWVSSYAYPPDFFTVDPKPDDDNVPRLMADYTVGDTISAAAKIGQLDIQVTGRITEARVTQRSPAGGANVSLNCVPDIASAPTEGDGIT